MACGILPGVSSLEGEMGRQDLNLRTGTGSTLAQLDICFRQLQLEEATISALEESLDHRSPMQHLPGFADILGLWPEWLRIRKWGDVRVENPFPIPVTVMGQRSEGRVVWRLVLKQQEAKLSEQQKLVLNLFNHWEADHPEQFYDDWRRRWNTTEVNLLNSFLVQVFDQADQALQVCAHGRYYDLVQSHITINVQSLKQAEMNIENKHTHKLDAIVHPDLKRPYESDPILIERAFLYAENVAKVVESAEDKDIWPPSKDEISYEDVWWWMMLRSQAWCMSHEVIQREGIQIPSEFFDSPARVYIL